MHYRMDSAALAGLSWENHENADSVTVYPGLAALALGFQRPALRASPPLRHGF